MICMEAYVPFRKSDTANLDMKTALAALALTMMIAGCAEKERFPERYLDSIALAIHPDRPAEVSGFLRRGTVPANALEYSDLTGATRISFDCGPEDSSRLAEIMENSPVPVQVRLRNDDLPSSVRYRQEGITWRPLYSWSQEGDSCSFSARVLISNTTGREWFSRHTTFMDAPGEMVCLVPETLIIRTGDMELGWWKADGRVLPLTLSYGWPLHSQWNQLIPCLVPEAGELLDARWPVRTGDTLWVRPEVPLEISEQVHPNSAGYECTLILHNRTEDYAEVRITVPERTPRGARFRPGGDFPSFLGLQPGDIAVLEYGIVYE